MTIVLPVAPRISISPVSFSADVQSGNSIAWTHFSPADENRAVLAFFGFDRQTIVINTCTCNTVSMTKIAEHTIEIGTIDGRIEVWALFNPPAGENSIVATTSASFTGSASARAIAVTLGGVHKDIIDSPALSTTGTTVSSLSLSPQVNDAYGLLVSMVLAQTNTTTFSAENGDTFLIGKQTCDSSAWQVSYRFPDKLGPQGCSFSISPARDAGLVSLAIRSN